VKTLTLHAGAAGKASITLKGTGLPLDLPGLPVSSPPVVVQLQGGAGQCWGATYSSTLRNRVGELKARSD
jgi:hypothetical protein